MPVDFFRFHHWLARSSLALARSLAISSEDKTGINDIGPSIERLFTEWLSSGFYHWLTHALRRSGASALTQTLLCGGPVRCCRSSDAPTPQPDTGKARCLAFDARREGALRA